MESKKIQWSGNINLSTYQNLRDIKQTKVPISYPHIIFNHNRPLNGHLEGGQSLDNDVIFHVLRWILIHL